MSESGCRHLEFNPWKGFRGLPHLTEERYWLKQYLNNSEVWFAEGSFDNVKDESITN